jgi:hypothetical protein
MAKVITKTVSKWSKEKVELFEGFLAEAKMVVEEKVGKEVSAVNKQSLYSMGLGWNDISEAKEQGICSVFTRPSSGKKGYVTLVSLKSWTPERVETEEVQAFHAMK